MTWLVIRSVHDIAALWAAERLRNAGLAPCTVVTDADLAGVTWQYEAGDNGARSLLRFADGREIDSHDVCGTINRLTHVPATAVAAISADERMYALQEMNALVLSWLASLPGPILNPPHARGLSGAWRSPAEWAMLASESGLEPVPVRSDWQSPGYTGPWITWGNAAPEAENVIVVGSVVFADLDLDTRTQDACRQLSANANMPVIGLAFEEGRLAGVSPLPDLREGGDDLVDALVAALKTP